MNEPVAKPQAPMIVEFAGWYGMLAILGAYALNSICDVPAKSLSLALLNLSGALGVAWVCWWKRTWQAFWLESIWAGIAIVTLLRLAFGG